MIDLERSIRTSSHRYFLPSSQERPIEVGPVSTIEQTRQLHSSYQTDRIDRSLSVHHNPPSPIETLRHSSRLFQPIRQFFQELHAYPGLGCDRVNRRYPMFRTAIYVTTLLATFLLTTGVVDAQCSSLSLPMQEGMSVGTMASILAPNSEHVVVLYDTRDPDVNAPGFDTFWQLPQTHNAPGPDAWTKGNLGEVFGVTLDNASPPNIYVTATRIFGFGGIGSVGPGGSGAVYRLDGTTGAISTFASIPAGIASLGNIDHDAAGGHYYVSSLDDGLIYQLDPLGTIVGSYDHGFTNGQPADDPTRPYTQKGRRVWGLQVNELEDRLYYGVWNESGTDDPSVQNEVYSVALNGVTRSPIPATLQLEVSVAPFALSSGSLAVAPIADISFDDTASRMILGQRSMSEGNNGAISNSAHASRVLEFTGSTGAWLASVDDKFLVGNYGSGSNAAGGVDFDCEGNVWATGDAIHFYSPDTIYGMVRIPSTGSSNVAPFAQSSYLVDFNCNNTANDVDKTLMGDVEHYRENCGVCSIEDEEILCDPDATGSYAYTFTVTNNSGIDADRLRFFTSGFSITPETIFAPIQSGSSETFTVTISGAAPGTPICFEVWLMADQFTQCCVLEHCIELPRCCADIATIRLECDSENPGSYLFDFTVTNQSTIPVDRIFLWPQPQPMPGYSFSVDEFTAPADFMGPLLTGQTTPTLSTSIVGGAPGSQICFEISIHDSQTGECCFEEVCLILPECTDPCNAEQCSLTEIKPCQQLPGSDIHVAIVEATICNLCSDEPVAFEWSLDGAVSAACPIPFLTPANFSPSTGSTPLLPLGECFTFNITVDCTQLLPGDSACYEITFTNPNTGEQTICDGRVLRPNGVVGGVGVEPADPVIDIPFGEVQIVSFELAHLGGQQIPTEVTVSEFAPGITTNPRLSLNGRAIGASSTFPIDLPTDTTGLASVSVSIPVHDPLDFATFYLLVDTDGDGLEEPILSATVRSIIPGDCNGNGILDDIEIAVGLLVDANGDGVPDICGSGNPSFIRGDANGDQIYDIGDTIFSLAYIFQGGQDPACFEAADSNSDAALDVGDVIFSLGALFGSGQLPADPYPNCGMSQFNPLGCEESNCP